MNGFTPKVLDLVTAIVWGAAWHAANSVASSTHEFFRHLANDAVDDDKQINTAVLNLKRKRIMPNEVVDRIKWMAWDSAWGASNDRLGSGGAASWDKVCVELCIWCSHPRQADDDIANRKLTQRTEAVACGALATHART